MASFTRVAGGWRAQIDKRGVRKSLTLPTKAAVQAWAAQEEAIITAGYRGVAAPGATFGDLLERYSREVSPAKKGSRWEGIRIALLKRDPVAAVPLTKLAPPHVADWRDRRLQAVSPSSVRREMNLMAHACTIAVREWRMLRENPFSMVRKPRDAKPRHRLITTEEMERIGKAATSDIQRRAYMAALFGIETAMRMGEICGLKSPAVVGRVAHLEDTKNGTARDVPLSTEALRLWAEVGGDGFGLTPAQLDPAWRTLCHRAGVTEVHFHDTRRTAITRLSKRLDVRELAKMVGHHDLRILLDVYYQDDAQATAAKLV